MTAFPLIERLSPDEGPLDVLLDVGVGHSTRKSPAPNPLVEGAESSSKNETEQVTIKKIVVMEWMALVYWDPLNNMKYRITIPGDIYKIVQYNMWH